jgi:hypothetical protein
MCIPSIYFWYNGIGNQILAMLNIIHYTFHFKNFKALKLPGNPFFALINEKNTRVDRDDATCDCDEITDITRRINPCSDWFCLGIKELKRTFTKNVRYKFADDITTIQYDIGIHIRSGDIFGGNVHWEYVQPPLDYYVEIIKRNPTKSIVIVYDINTRKPHWRNPVLDKLFEYIKNNNLTNITIQSKSIREDIATLCSSKTIICAMGTFSFMCYIISPITQQIYIPHYMVNKCRGKNWFTLNKEDLDIVKIVDISSYIKVGSWKNKPEQQEMMINYKMNKNELEKLTIDV